MVRQPRPPLREERVSAAKPQPWHDDDASRISRRREHGSPVFDQIIVETVEQPARHRPSLAFILGVFVTGLFMGAIALMICVLCQLKALSGRYWPVAQKDDTFCVVENHGKLLADIKFQQQQANLPAETPMANNERDVLQSRSFTIKCLTREKPRGLQQQQRRQIGQPNAPSVGNPNDPLEISDCGFASTR
ncbi:hypothetical protein MTO96_030829 [Rhipicephalus appendiculatus]